MPSEELALDSSGVCRKEEGRCGEQVRSSSGRVQTLRLGCRRRWHGTFTGHREVAFVVAALDAYRFSPAESDRDHRMKKLKCCYTGSKDFDPAHFFGAPQQEAIERAERLHDRHKDVVHPRDRNPWTDIHLLVRRLLE